MGQNDFAIRLLYSVFPNAEIQLLRSQFSDLIVSLPDDSLQFCVAVQTMEVKNLANQERLRDKFGFYTRSTGAARIPIIVLAVDPDKQKAEAGMALSWEFGFPVIKKPFIFTPLNSDNADKVLDYIKAADKTIHSLSEQSSRFLKTIIVRDDSVEAYFCYFRDFSIDYRMKDHPKDENQFEVYLKGVDESLFPSDELDASILSAFQKHYSATVRTSLFIFSSDLSNLQRKINNHKCSSVHIRHFLLNGALVKGRTPTVELKGYALYDRENKFSDQVWLDATIEQQSYNRLISSFHDIGTLIR